MPLRSPSCGFSPGYPSHLIPGLALPLRSEHSYGFASVSGRNLTVSVAQDFGDPAVVLFEDMDFQGNRVEVSSALPDVELAQHGPCTQAIHVLSGV